MIFKFGLEKKEAKRRLPTVCVLGSIVDRSPRIAIGKQQGYTEADFTA